MDPEGARSLVQILGSGSRARRNSFLSLGSWQSGGGEPYSDSPTPRGRRGLAGEPEPERARAGSEAGLRGPREKPVGRPGPENSASFLHLEKKVWVVVLVRKLRR